MSTGLTLNNETTGNRIDVDTSVLIKKLEQNVLKGKFISK
jgi:hypothetical protein